MNKSHQVQPGGSLDSRDKTPLDCVEIGLEVAHYTILWRTKKSGPFNYTATDYIAAGEYQVYKYYYLNMTGTRLQTTGSGDRQLHVYTTHYHKTVKLMVEARFSQGLWYVRLDNLGAFGLPSAGNLTIQTWGFPGATVWTPVDAPTDLGKYAHT